MVLAIEWRGRRLTFSEGRLAETEWRFTFSSEKSRRRDGIKVCIGPGTRENLFGLKSAAGAHWQANTNQPCPSLSVMSRHFLIILPDFLSHGSQKVLHPAPPRSCESSGVQEAQNNTGLRHEIVC
jgi:hypothetical protein